MTNKPSILIIDDHPLFREGLKAIIGLDRRFEVVGEAGTAQNGLQLARSLQPNLVLLDISLPDQSGIHLTREIRGLLPDTQVLIVSMHARIDHIAEALQAGATGYVVKESAAEKLLKGIEFVLKGEYFLDSSVSGQVAKRLIEWPARHEQIRDAGYDSLSAREQEVMRLLVEGLSKKEIAQRLSISPKTVENHYANIMNKLGLQSIVDLIHYAARLGLIDVDLWKE